ncbi:hypothetical protein GQ53DRAFT_740229 [Thozetella sp. PMI_491]|nr:hypothetical protein GQ53DRAFT_740229 [Thozetella sp. PMI_491]
MHLPPLLLQSIAILALASPALSCVQFSINYVCPGTIFGSCWNGDLYETNAALTDNGGQVCSLTNRKGAVPGCASIELSCIGGYRAVFNTDTTVDYSYGSFSGSFGTSLQKVGDKCYYTANVWGC